jgi:prepilin-type N-terminal cleavage/methylation domain-containing protein
MNNIRAAGVAFHLQETRRAFTLTELLVVIAIMALLATMALSAAVTSRSHVLQAQCAGNLRQIGVGMNIYAAEANGYAPICNFRNQTTWYSYLMGRVEPETSILTVGYVNLGLLYRIKAVTDPKMFYCPAQTTTHASYDYYATSTNGWPSTPSGSGDDKIRSGYAYFPQLRVTERYYNYTLPKVTTLTVPLEYGTCEALTPARLTEVNPQKSLTTDLIGSSSGALAHRGNNSPEGVNALFPDGKVVFQSAWSNPQAFDTSIWDVIGNDNGLTFRAVMNSWQP